VLALLLASALTLDVPYARQETDTCGAAALVMVASYWGHPLVQEDVARALLQPERGIRGSELAGFARQHGLIAHAYAGDLDHLIDYLEKGRPLIVAWRVEGDLLHDVVVVGWDAQRGDVIVHDPARGAGDRVSRVEFEKRWAGAGHWTLLVLPADD
jgi:ABC-type bacteriocin/lantibiotic exporter with double-glycine peptidase domain